MTEKSVSDLTFAHLTPLQRQVLVQKIDDVLPQTQCQRCGYQDCFHYAQAIVEGGEKINLCPPGGLYGIERLGTLTQQSACELDPEVGPQTQHSLAVIDETWCIGCTKCLRACPVDAILGAKKMAHVVVTQYCTGCELCVQVCPVDCIEIVPTQDGEEPVPGQSLWSQAQSHLFKERYAVHKERMERLLQLRLAKMSAPAQAQTSQEKSDKGSPEALAIAEQPQQKKALLDQIMQQAKAKLAQQPKE